MDIPNDIDLDVVIADLLESSFILKQCGFYCDWQLAVGQSPDIESMSRYEMMPWAFVHEFRVRLRNLADESPWWSGDWLFEPDDPNELFSVLPFSDLLVFLNEILLLRLERIILRRWAIQSLLMFSSTTFFSSDRGTRFNSSWHH
jgi:hypothetical protein